MISINSIVIFIWRALLYDKVNLDSISPAFLEALSIAAIRWDWRKKQEWDKKGTRMGQEWDKTEIEEKRRNWVEHRWSWEEI